MPSKIHPIICSQATELSHPDKAKLLDGKKAMEEVAEFTNEYKRRKDIGEHQCLYEASNDPKGSY